MIAEHGDIGDASAPQRVDKGVERAAAMTFDDALAAAIRECRIDRTTVTVRHGAVVDEVDFALSQVALGKHAPDVRGAGLLTSAVGPFLADAPEFDLQRTCQLNPLAA